jgi:hypothetical protein
VEIDVTTFSNLYRGQGFLGSKTGAAKAYDRTIQLRGHGPLLINSVPSISIRRVRPAHSITAPVYAINLECGP